MNISDLYNQVNSKCADKNYPSVDKNRFLVVITEMEHKGEVDVRDNGEVSNTPEARAALPYPLRQAKPLVVAC